MIKIYHNPRCRKSREGLAIVEASGKKFEIIKYLDDQLSEAALTEIINLLGIAPIALVRKNEKIWKEEFKGKTLSDAAIISALAEHPKLIERPIVVKGNKAVLGRPPENVLELI